MHTKVPWSCNFGISDTHSLDSANWGFENSCSYGFYDQNRVGDCFAPVLIKTHTTDQNKVYFGNRFIQRTGKSKTFALVPNGSVSPSTSPESESRAVGDAHRRRSSLESLFCYDKAVPEERIETPVGISLCEKEIGDNRRCGDCEAKGVILCATCSGSGLYVDSILESKGIIVKVRCLGCGGTGNVMCAECGGRGHLGSK